MIQVAIYSPLPALRAGLRALLSDDPDIQVAAAADRLEDGALPGGDNLTAVDVIVYSPGGLGDDAPGLPALLLVTADLREVEQLAGLALPAWGAVSPDAPGEALRAAVRALAEGLVALSPEFAQMRGTPALAGEPGLPAAGRRAYPLSSALPGREAEPDSPLDIDEPLTPREIDVLRLMAEGLTNKAIALSLGISEHTVKFHVSSIYARLNVANRAEAVRKGARAGWVAI